MLTTRVASTCFVVSSTAFVRSLTSSTVNGAMRGATAGATGNSEGSLRSVMGAPLRWRAPHDVLAPEKRRNQRSCGARRSVFLLLHEFDERAERRLRVD